MARLTAAARLPHAVLCCLFLCALAAAPSAALAQPFSISGTVTAGGAAPPSGGSLLIQVSRLSDSSLTFVTAASVNAAGAFSITGLTDGTYYLRTSNTKGLVDEAFGGAICINGTCSLTTVGTAITISGSSLAGRDFDLALGGTIAGTVTNASTSAAVSGVSILVYTSAGTSLGGPQPTSTAGAYATGFGLPAGTYFVKTQNSVGLVDQLYTGITCVGSACTSVATITAGTPITVTSGSAATADFALAPGATITGTFRSAATGNPINGTGSGVSVSMAVFTAAGLQVTQSNVNASGVYNTLNGLPSGTYYIKTSNNQGYIDQLYNGNNCPNGQCTLTTGTPFVVSSAGSSTVDFTLAVGGEISGVVTRTDTTPASGVNSVNVQVYNASGSSAGSANTATLSAVAGSYRVRGLPTGTYFVRTSNSAGLIDKLHETTVCVPSCTVTTGTGVEVVAGETDTVNFALDLGGSITGTITNAAGTALTPVSVTIVNASNQTVRSATTSALGVYTVTGLTAGTYFARTSNGLGYINEAYNDRTCVGCNAATTGDGIAVTLGAATPGIDFQLTDGARVSGTITDSASAPLAGIVVNIHGATGSVLTTATSAADGTYTASGLPTGTVYARTSNSLGYLDKLHSGIPCLACSATAGTPITVTAGSTTSGINFSLAAGGRITGTITHASTGAVVPSASLSFYTNQGSFAGGASANSLGVYQSPGLPTGTYFVTASSSGFIRELYNDIICTSCGSSAVINGTPVTVTAGSTTSAINVALAPGGSVTGTVTESGTSTPIAGANINLYNASNTFVASGVSNAQGVYSITGVPSGTYYARTSLASSSNYLNQVYNSSGNLACNNCNAVEVGTAVVVASPSATAGINFSLIAGGSISGTVVDGGNSNAAIAFLSVQAYDSDGSFVKSAITNAQGLYTIAGLPAGSYFLRTSTSLYVNQVYAGLACTSCTATTGTAVTVTVGQTTTGRDFTLTAGGRIGGTVVSGSTPLSGVTVSFVTSTGASAGSAATNASGVYLSGAMLPGTYYARTSNGGGYVNEVYNNLPCVSCQASAGTAITVTSSVTTSGISFDLAAGGKIGGTVTDSGTGEPLPGATAFVYTPTGTFVTSATTNDAGVYLTTAGLSAGTYHLYFSATGYVSEVYNNVVCPSCPRQSGAGVTVTAGATTPGIDAALAQGGRVTGRVVDAAGAPIEGVLITIVDKATGSSPGSGTTSASGSYAVTGIAAGSYTARATNALGYLNEIYDDIRCATCTVQSAGTAFDVASGATTADINFALAPGGRISGTVRNAGGTPLSVGLSVYDAQNQIVTSMSTNQLGAYTTAGVPAGRYYVRTTSNSGGYINQLYSGIPCRTCSANTGTPVTVVVGATTPNIDFSLIVGTSISGTVRDASNAGVANVTVRLLDADNSTVASTVTAANGTYTVTGLTAGVYYARTSNTVGLIDRIYNNVVCVFCSATAGTPITVAVGTPATGIDFALGAGGGISGTIVDGAGAPIGGVTVNIHGSNGEFVQSRTTDALGQYATTIGLTAGNYYVRTSNSLGYIDEVYNNVVCIQCNPRDGAPIAVTAGAITPDINFGLTTGGLISGTIVASGGGAIDRVTVLVYTAAGVQVTSGTTNPAGQYRTGALPPGAYYVRTRNSLGYTDEVYNDRECSNCNPTLGNAVTVTGDTTTTGIDFTLVLGGRISGAVTAVGGAALAGVTVRIATSGGVQVTSGVTDGLGAYVTQQGLPTGTYYAQTSNNIGYVDRIYNGVDCQGCQPYVGTPITVTAGTPTTGINFTLTAGGRISGTITDASTSQPIYPAFVNVYSSTGVFVVSASVGSSGQYITGTGLAPGNYFVRAASRAGYISKVWNDINCSACSPITGTPVTVTADTTTTGISFALSLGGKVSGRVTDAAGAPLRNITVQTFNAANSLVTTSSTDAAGQYVSASGLPVGTYYVKTSNNQGYIDEVYNNAACIGGCAPNSGTGVAVAAGADVTGIDFSLAAGGKISGTVTRSVDSTPMSGVTVRVYDSTLRVVTSAMTDSAGGYVTYGGLPAGTYYVRTDNGFGYIDEVFDNVPCIACDPRLATGVAVAAAATTSSISFALGNGGGISGTVTAGDTGLPLGNVRIHLYSSSGSYIASTTTDAAGRYAGSGVAAGSYFLRTFNLQGYIDEAFDDLACAPCNLLASSGVTVTAGATATGRNFVLAKGGLVSGYVTDASTGAPILGATVSFFSGSTLVGKARQTDENGYYAISLPVGTYSVVTDAVNGYASSGTSSRMRIGQGPWMANATGTVSVALGQETAGVTFGLAACTPPAFTTTALATGRMGVVYSQTVTASGGTGTRTFSLASGLLTPGLTLNTATGAITGTPTASGTANFALGVADANSCAATQDFAITTDIPLATASLSPASLTFAAVKAGAAGALTSVTDAQSVSVTFSSGAPAWTVSSDASWLSLSTSGGTGAGAFTASIVNPSNVIGGNTTLSATITLAADGVSNAPRTLAVTLTVDQSGGATAVVPIGQVDTPSQSATGVQGAIGVTGWALDNVGVTGVKIYRNCLAFENQASCQIVLGNNVVFVGDAAFLAGARPDVETAFSTYPQNNRAGWGYLMLTSMLPHVTLERGYGGQGALTLYAVATDVEGNQKLLGRSSDPASADFATPTAITMANDSIAKPFGAIDTPGQGQTVSGLLNNFGWALTPDANSTAGTGDILIPTDGSTMTVFIDSLPVALVTYNQCRGNVGNPVPTGQFCNDDVANIFGNAAPQAVQTIRTGNPTLFRNLDAGRSAIGSYSFNTATLSNGLHTIAWSVSDSAGRNEGIGSRFFNVLNSGADAAIRAECGVESAGCADAVARADAALRARPAEIRGPAWALGGLAPGIDGVWVRRGFDLSAAWADLPVDENGERVVEIEEGGRLDLWLGAPVDGGYLVANGTLRDLPVGASVDGARVTWAPPVGYVGEYRLALIRNDQRIDVVVRVGAK